MIIITIGISKGNEYIVKEGPDFKIETENVDDEISIIAGPQLVVPIDNVDMH